ncbi:hypothetical protein PRIPAC_96469 [Pristionchus pacificus]|uniref:G protein-coupled receptor n=1 Tax=Pristionchus pacificus TaxID=54126 RepID=A0A2A6BIT7_PRIPA|nr:hypothetical protein PRIPAC_96469 [Pristionchus pacificus]|eukprot:PDM65763.1 G protein-coupled receptor [Pristionchus pacificus]
MKKRDYMSWDIRLAYAINQIAMMIQEFNFCFLFRVHDLAPYAGLYCDGPICRAGIPKPYLMAILSFTTIGTVPTFLILLLRMHQLIIETTDSQLKLHRRTQCGIILFLTLLLSPNVAGFYSFGRDCREVEEMEKLPDLAWLKDRGGTLFLFGPPGRPEFFKIELIMLLCSIAIISPFVAVASVHSMKIMREQKLRQSLASNTQRLQTRVVRVFFLQLLGVNCFYICPLSFMLLHMAIDVSWILPPWMYSIARCALIVYIPFTLESSQLSLIFLLKNRQIIRDAILQLSLYNKTSNTHVSIVDRNPAWADANVPTTKSRITD